MFRYEIIGMLTADAGESRAAGDHVAHCRTLTRHDHGHDRVTGLHVLDDRVTGIHVLLGKLQFPCSVMGLYRGTSLVRNSPSP